MHGHMDMSIQTLKSEDFLDVALLRSKHWEAHKFGQYNESPGILRRLQALLHHLGGT